MALRAATAACIAAAVPSALVYVGDVVPFGRRQAALTDLNAASAVGITSAIGLGGVLAATAGRRVAFLLPALVAAVLVVALRRWATVCGVGVTLAAGFGVAATLGSARSLREAATNA